MIIQFDPFDTEIFKINAYKIMLSRTETFQAAVHELKKIQSGFISAFAPVSVRLNKALQENNFYLVSIRNRYCFATSGKFEHIDHGDTVVRELGESEEISEKDSTAIARTVYTYSRYYRDDKLSKTAGLALYRAWVKNSLYRGYAQKCFLLFNKGHAVGLATLKQKEKNVYIDLFAVTPEFQGKHNGSALLQTSLRVARSMHADNIYVITEGENIRANAFYQKNGGVLDDVCLVYHKHI